jgi:signal transduction histidine kinase
LLVRFRRPNVTVGLPARLLLLTVLFVMLAEIMIFVPSMSNFRMNWLNERLMAGQIASLSIEAADGGELPPRLRSELLNTAGVYAVSLKRDNLRQLVLQMATDKPVGAVYDLREGNWATNIRDAFEAIWSPPGRVIRVLGVPEMGAGDEIDIVIDEGPLRAALWKFASNILWLSLIISIFTAALVYLALHALLVRPMMRLTRNMVNYRDNPEDLARIIQPSGRTDEIGVAEQELAVMQTQLSAFLKEKNRLAMLGLAVSKINHDLRNMLASAQLVSDRLASIEDPTVQRFLPRLIRALDRAIALCVDTLAYGRSSEPPPKRTRFPLRPLADEIAESLGLDDGAGVQMHIDLNPGLTLVADRDQLFRVLSNLLRNAVQALTEGEQPGLVPELRLSGYREGAATYIRVRDNGPGIPPQLRPNLFKPFHSSARKGGTGLGLVISSELVAANGGRIILEDTTEGASFLLIFPDDAGNGPITARDRTGAGAGPGNGTV